MTKKRTPQFPKQIYVRQERQHNGEAYLVVDNALDDEAEDGESVAIYELKIVQTLHITRRLE